MKEYVRPTVVPLDKEKVSKTGENNVEGGEDGVRVGENSIEE